MLQAYGNPNTITEKRKIMFNSRIRKTVLAVIVLSLSFGVLAIEGMAEESQITPYDDFEYAELNESENDTLYIADTAPTEMPGSIEYDTSEHIAFEEIEKNDTVDFFEIHNLYDVDGELRYFYETYGRRAVNILSEDIVAYYYDVYEPKFDLIDWNVGFPSLFGTFFGPRERDCNDYKHRLDKAAYDLKIHSDLEPMIDEIVKHCLTLDCVAPFGAEIYPPGLRLSNTEVLEQFIAENVNIEIIQEGQMSEEDYESLSRSKWYVLSGGCFFNTIHGLKPNTCHEHKFIIWLADNMYETNRTIWDLKIVEDSGCGNLLPSLR